MTVTELIKKIDSGEWEVVETEYGDGCIWATICCVSCMDKPEEIGGSDESKGTIREINE